MAGVESSGDGDMSSFSSEGGSKVLMAPGGLHYPLLVTTNTLMEGGNLDGITQLPQGPVKWLCAWQPELGPHGGENPAAPPCRLQCQRRPFLEVTITPLLCRMLYSTQ